MNALPNSFHSALAPAMAAESITAPVSDPPVAVIANSDSAVTNAGYPVAVIEPSPHPVTAAGDNSSSCGDDGGQVGDPADAAGVRSGSVTLRAKQATENGSKVGALQISVSPVFSGQTLSIK